MVQDLGDAVTAIESQSVFRLRMTGGAALRAWALELLLSTADRTRKGERGGPLFFDTSSRYRCFLA